MLKKLFALCLYLGLIACASPTVMSYGPKDSKMRRPYGYVEDVQQDGSYILSVEYPASINGVTIIQTHWDKRAEELCGSSDYTKNIFSASNPTQLYSNYGGRPSGVLKLKGFLFCNEEAFSTTEDVEEAPFKTSDAEPSAEG